MYKNIHYDFWFGLKISVLCVYDSVFTVRLHCKVHAIFLGTNFFSVSILILYRANYEEFIYFEIEFFGKTYPMIKCMNNTLTNK